MKEIIKPPLISLYVTVNCTHGPHSAIALMGTMRPKQRRSRDRSTKATLQVSSGLFRTVLVVWLSDQNESF